MPITFLKSWTIDVDRMPSYAMFRGQFELSLDYKILEMIGKLPPDRLADDKKVTLLTVLNNIDKKTNILKISHTPIYGLGRFYANRGDNTSPIVMPRTIKHTLFKYLGWVDLDMVKGHPSIMINVARLATPSLDLKYVRRYIEENDAITREVQQFYTPEGEDEPILPVDTVKFLFNLLIYGGGLPRWINDVAQNEGIEVKTSAMHPFVRDFQKDCHQVMNLIYTNNPGMVAKVHKEGDDEHADKRRTVSYFWQCLENEIVHISAKVLITSGIMEHRKFALEYDGICFCPKDSGINPIGPDMDSILFDVNSTIMSKTGMNVTMKWKPYHKDHILQDVIDDRVSIPVVATPVGGGGVDVVEIISDDFTFENWIPITHGANEFNQLIERDHFKVMESGDYYCDLGGGKTHQYSKQQIQNKFQQYNIDIGIGKKLKKKYLVDMWMDSPTIRCYARFGMYPPPLVCPRNVYNLWKPFAVETLTVLEKDEHGKCIIPEELNEYINTAVAFLNHHIMIMTNRDIDVYEYFMGWLCFLFTHPALKSGKMPYFLGSPGNGKSELANLIRHLVGPDPITLTTSTPDRDVYGTFNPKMMTAYLIIIEELDEKQTKEYTGKIKHILTGTEIGVYPKGKNLITINSYHKMMALSNNIGDPPIASTEDDRRNLLIRCSDELIIKKNPIVNTQYFRDCREYSQDPRVQMVFYERLLEKYTNPKFIEIQLPISQYQLLQQQSNREAVDLFLENYVRMNAESDQITKSNIELFGSFTNWATDTKCPYSTSQNKFTRHLGSFIMKLPDDCYHKTKHSRTGNGYILYIDALKIHYGIESDNMPSGLIPSLIPITTTATINPELGGGETMESFNRVTCPSSSLARRPREDDPNEIEEDFNAIVKPKEKKSKGTNNTLKKSTTL